MVNTQFSNDEVFILDESKIFELKKIALSHPLKRSRLCLHKDRNDPVQEMIIVAHKDSYIEPHRHPLNKPESYHIIEGVLEVKIFSDQGQVIKNFFLGDSSNLKIYRIEGNIWHQPIPLSEWVIYHEVYTGPFDKDIDVTYMSDHTE